MFLRPLRCSFLLIGALLYCPLYVWAQAQPRIAVRASSPPSWGYEFYNKVTGERFIPIGTSYNHLIKDHSPNPLYSYHHWPELDDALVTFDPDYYDSSDMADVLDEMQSLGFNTVRFFIYNVAWFDNAGNVVVRAGSVSRNQLSIAPTDAPTFLYVALPECLTRPTWFPPQ